MPSQQDFWVAQFVNSYEGQEVAVPGGMFRVLAETVDSETDGPIYIYSRLIEEEVRDYHLKNDFLTIQANVAFHETLHDFGIKHGDAANDGDKGTLDPKTDEDGQPGVDAAGNPTPDPNLPTPKQEAFIRNVLWLGHR